MAPWLAFPRSAMSRKIAKACENGVVRRGKRIVVKDLIKTFRDERYEDGEEMRDAVDDGDKVLHDV